MAQRFPVLRHQGCGEAQDTENQYSTNKATTLQITNVKYTSQQPDKKKITSRTLYKKL